MFFLVCKKRTRKQVRFFSCFYLECDVSVLIGFILVVMVAAAVAVILKFKLQGFAAGGTDVASLGYFVLIQVKGFAAAVAGDFINGIVILVIFIVFVEVIVTVNFFG